MTTQEDRLRQKQLAFGQAFCSDVQLRLTRWQMVRWMFRAIFSPRGAYVLTFKGGNWRPNPIAAIVLADLERASGINRGGIVVSPISRIVDSYATVYRAGLRDMYLRIIKMIGINEGNNVEERHDRTE